MKALFVVVIVGVVAWFYGDVRAANKRAEDIAQHRFAMAWPMSDVRASRGEPIAVQAQSAGAQTWVYADGQAITFSPAGRVVGSAFVAPRAVPVPVPARAPSADRQVTYVPQLERYVEHDPSVSAATAAGLSAYTGVARATPANPLNQRPRHQ